MFLLRLIDLSSELERIVSTDLAFSDPQGHTVSFDAATKSKNEALSPLLSLLNRLADAVCAELDPAIDPCLDKVKNQVSKWKSLIEEVTDPDSHSRRMDATQFRSSIGSQVSNLVSQTLVVTQELTPLIVLSETAAQLKQINGPALTQATASANENLQFNQKEFAEMQDHFKKWQTILENLLAKASKKEAKTRFSELSASHSTWQYIWLIVLVVAASILFCFVWTTWHENGAVSPNQSNIIWHIFRRSVWLGSGLLLFRTALTKFNTERHLTIVYKHRNAALHQLELMEGVLADNIPAKAELRIAAAKMILSDPATGYASTTSGSDFNFNPVIAAIERAGTKSPQA